jgi:nucleoside-diphosphate-sugar epimerase
MKRRVLLTGATGFVGRQILAALSKADVAPRLVLRSGGSALEYEDNNADLIYTNDLFSESEDWWAETCKQVDTIIHAAWYAEPGQYIHSPKNIECVKGTLNLALGASRAGIRRFIGVGSCAEYEMSNNILTVDSPLRPTSVYGGAKAATYIALKSYLSNQGIEFAWCRLFYLYGAGEHSTRLVPYLHARLALGQPVELTDGNQIRDFLDVEIAGSEIVKIALGNSLGAVNVCSGVGSTVRQFAESIADQYGRRDLLKFGVRQANPFDPPCVIGMREKEC